MYVDTQVRPQGEQVDAVAPTKLKLSEAIRIGSRDVPESRNHWGCALGAACHATGLTVTIQNYVEVGRDQGMYRHLEAALNVSHELLESVSVMHYIGKRTRAEIADWLEAQGL